MENYIGFIYLTTNLINNKIYIGQRKITNRPNKDELYLGSGNLITKAIKKYGRHNFNRTILKFCETIDELNSSEIFL
jgi:hypothetical protein